MNKAFVAGLALLLLGSSTMMTHAQQVPDTSFYRLWQLHAEAYRPGTIAIAASGANAGEAVFRALEKAEKISSGSIGGVAYFVAMTSDGSIHEYQNYGRGGTRTLFIRGEETGVPPPPEIAAAPIAGVISTGPREPRSDLFANNPFPTHGNGVGFVVGHRLPSSIGKSQVPVNHEVFRLMQEGANAREAVDRVMNMNPDLDAGLIAVDRNGNIAMHNSRLVDQRPDYGRARGEDPAAGAVVETIMNEIHPPQAVAQLVVNVALDIMSAARTPDFQVTVRAGTRVDHAEENIVEVNDDLVATRITTNVRDHVEGRQVAVIPYILSRVIRDDEVLGYTVNEPLTVLENGIIDTVSTQTEMKVWVQRSPRVCDFETPYLTICRSI